MAVGMVRKVDELGRVVIPKEMRRILNIKTGSSIEMFINNDNQVVLKKFSELSNIMMFAENLCEVIFENFNLVCLISDDEKILVSKGINQKLFSQKSFEISSDKNKEYFLENSFKVDNQKVNFDFVYVFPIIFEGYNSGNIFLLSQVEVDVQVLKNIVILKKFLSNLLKF